MRFGRHFNALLAPLVGAFLLYGCTPAYAQVPGGGTITFRGAATPGDCPQIVSSTVQQDSGSACGGSGGGVTSLSFGAIGLTPSTATTGVITVGGTLGVANGGTGAITLTGVLKGNGTSAFSPATAGTDFVAPGTATTFTAVQTFTNSDIRLLGSSTGYTTFTSANASATNFTLTFPAATDTLVTLAASQTLTNKTLTSPALGGTVTGANTIPLTILAQTGANTVLGNATSGTANVATQSMPSCSGASNALQWTTNTGFGCNTISSGGASWNDNVTTSSAASANNIYCMNTNAGALTLTLSASPSNGDMVGFTDCGGNFGVHTLTIAHNGKNIMYQASDMQVTAPYSTATLRWSAGQSSWILSP